MLSQIPDVSDKHLLPLSIEREGHRLNKVYMLPHYSALLLPVSLTGVMNISRVDKRNPSAVK